jgi:chondroitin AC lyase
MAKTGLGYLNAGHPDSVLNAKVIRALHAWTSRDYQNPNWWWNEIGVPELIGEIASLMQPQLSPDELARVVEIMKRSNWRRVPWTGANLTWGVVIQIVRGCLEENPDPVAEGYRRLYQEIKIVSPAEEGIQEDYSFHQHGTQFYNGGYGLSYFNDVGRFIALAWGTRFQIPPDRMAIFSSYLLDGEQWLVRDDVIDYSSVGREITRKGKVIAQREWSVGEISPASPGYGLENVVTALAAESTPLQRELHAFAARLQGQRNAPEFIGNKQFWCSDFMAHRRQRFYTSVKMLSNRMLNGEKINNEGKQSEHLSDGVNLLYLTGDEYKDIFPVWDWTKLPGTTAIQGTLETGEMNPIGVRGKSAFAGGVSDGTYGMAAMDLARGNLLAKKAWFFFDDIYLCLGAGITLSDDSEHGVVTDLNQPLLKGDVFTNQSKHPVPYGMHSYHPGEIAWTYHNHVGYILGPDTRVFLKIGLQSGSWSEIGTGPSQPVTIPVFNLWLDHGYSPRADTYQYIVVPGVTMRQMAVRAAMLPIGVLANDEKIQAAWNSDLKLVMAAFRKPESLVTPIGRITVDHLCLLLIRKVAEGWKITASNPENKSLVLNVEIETHGAPIDLPGGNFAGSSVSSMLNAI